MGSVAGDDVRRDSAPAVYRARTGGFDGGGGGGGGREAQKCRKGNGIVRCGGAVAKRGAQIGWRRRELANELITDRSQNNRLAPRNLERKLLTSTRVRDGNANQKNDSTTAATI